MYTLFFKRFLDILIAFSSLVILSPVILVLIVIITFDLKGSPFFIQRRVGRDHKIFKVIKFKTMSDAKDSAGSLLPDNERITSIGKKVRSLSLDELPQLFNILNGSMSVIGPRPLLEKYLPLYSQRQLKRHRVRPGLTGLAQVMGRNSLTWSRKFDLDVRYVENLSFCLDFFILVKTTFLVIARKGVNSSEDKPMSTFTGS